MEAGEDREGGGGPDVDEEGDGHEGAERASAPPDPDHERRAAPRHGLFSPGLSIGTVTSATRVTPALRIRSMTSRTSP